MSAIPRQLVEIRDALLKKSAVEPKTPRILLSYFNAERRSQLTSAFVRAALDELRLATEPDFETVNIDAPIAFQLLAEKDKVTDTGKKTPDEGETETRKAPKAASTKREEPTLRVRVLDAAIRYPVDVNPDAPLSKATTLMLAKDFSQLPVVTNHKIQGAISWKSIGRRLALGASVSKVKDCLEDPVEIRSDSPLLTAIDLVTRSDYALIIDSSRRLVGLVTTADLSRQFYTLSEPFLLLREAENHIRQILGSHFSTEELKSFRDPRIKRPITTVSDLTMGEYLRILEQDDTWERLHLPVDRKLFLGSLEQARTVRNDVTHFDPDPLEAERLTALSEFVRLLQAIGECSP